jgi:hypothetical protein
VSCVASCAFSFSVYLCTLKVGSMITKILNDGVLFRQTDSFIKDSSLMAYDAVYLGEWFPTFRRFIVPSSSGVKQESFLPA